jgi:hypothetical protein
VPILELFYLNSLLKYVHTAVTNLNILSKIIILKSKDVNVPDPGKGVCADPVNRGGILEGGGPGPPGGNKERQLSPDKGRGKT